jgi:hypothetical protein
MPNCSESIMFIVSGSGIFLHWPLCSEGLWFWTCFRHMDKGSPSPDKEDGWNVNIIAHVYSTGESRNWECVELQNCVPHSPRRRRAIRIFHCGGRGGVGVGWGVGAADPEAIYNLCLILKPLLYKSFCSYSCDITLLMNLHAYKFNYILHDFGWRDNQVKSLTL